MPKNLLIICQKVDENDDLLGFFPAWIREFAHHYERVSVITLGAGEAQLPDNVAVYSLGKERGVSRLRRWIALFRNLYRQVPHHDAVFCHMSPIFALCAWPFSKFWHKRLVLWYLHRSRTLRLKLAVALCDAVVTSDIESLTLRSSNIHAVGHGVEVDRYSTPQRVAPDHRPLRILAVGRLSPIKDFGTLIRAAAHLHEDDIACEVRIIGKTVMKKDTQYAQQLHTLVNRLGIGHIVHFFGFVPHRTMPEHYRWADIVVGCTPTGGIDKALLEAMAAGCVVLTSNTVMKNYLGERAPELIFPHGDSRAPARLIGGIQDFNELARTMERLVSVHTPKVVVERIIPFL